MGIESIFILICMKNKILDILSKIFFWSLDKGVYNKEISKIMSVSNIPNKKLPNEDVWFEKWSKLLPFVNRKYYRTFSKYIGEDVNLMPDDVCHFIVERILNPKKYRGFYSDKNMFDRILSMQFDKNVTPLTYLRNINGVYYDINYNRIDKNSIEFTDFCNADKVVVKPSVDSCSGNGILFFEQKGNSFIGGENGTQKLSFDFLESYYKKNFVVQKAVKQSAYISQFCSTSVNTLRIQVYRSVRTGEIHIPNVIMRLGKMGSLVDNAHAGGCLVGIDVNTGILKDRVCNQYGEQFDTFNGVDFKNNTFVIPNFNEIKAFAKKVGECISHHHIIALDVMLDENNDPLLIEYNIDDFGLWAFQFTTGVAFGEFTDEIIDYCMMNKNKANILFV